MTKLDYAPIRKSMRETELDCDQWADNTLDELAHAVIKGAWPQLPLQKTIHPLAILATIYSVLYLVGVLAASLVFGARESAVISLVAIGTCFFAYAYQLSFPPGKSSRTTKAIEWLLVVSTWGFGAFALIALAVR